MHETNFTLGPIQKYLYLLLLYQFTFAQNRQKSDISGALGPIHCVFFSDPFPYPHNQNPLPSVVVFSLIDQAWPALCAVLPLENPSWTRTP